MSQQSPVAVCLARALRDGELIPDIASACAMAGWDVTSLASGQHSDKEVSERLFLTPQEAAKLLHECRAYVTETAEGGAAVAACDDVPMQGDVLEAAHEEEEPDCMLELGLEPPHDAGAFCTPPELSPRSTGEQQPAAPSQQDGIVSVQLAGGSRQRGARAVLAKLAAAPKQPSSERLSALRTSCPAAIGTAAPQRDGNSVPSYLRSTATFQARVKNAPEPIVEEAPQPVALPKKTSKKFRNVVAKVFAPTAAFLARIMSKKGEEEEAKGNSSGDVLRRSAMNIILKSPQGQRVTTATPFSLHQSLRLRDAAPKLNTDEAALVEAQKAAFKPNPVPKHVHEQRPIEGFKAASTPKDPQQVFEPFNLASQERHAAEMARLAAEQADKEREDQRIRKFKALKLNKDMIDHVVTPPKPEPRAPTTPVAPKLLVEQRSKHHETEVAPARRARMTVVETQKLEERKRRAEAEEAQALQAKQQEEEELKAACQMEQTEVSQLRKSLVFKARVMPGFETVFRPDLSKAPKVTQSAEFKLRTEARLGKAVGWADRRDHAASQLGSGRYDALGYADSFASSLRSSGWGAQGKAALSNSRGGSMQMTRSVVLSPKGYVPTAQKQGRSGLSASQDLGAALNSALNACRRSGATVAVVRASPAARGGVAASPSASAHNSPRVMVPAV